MTTTKITTATQLKKGDIIKSGKYFAEVIETLGEVMFIGSLENTVEEARNSISTNTTNINCLIKNDNELILPDWSPSELKAGDGYWAIDSKGDIIWNIWNGNKYDLFRLKTNNIFRDEASAEARLAEIMKD